MKNRINVFKLGAVFTACLALSFCATAIDPGANNSAGDTTMPVLTVTSPDNEQEVGNIYQITGKVSDSGGSGIKAVNISTGGGSEISAWVSLDNWMITLTNDNFGFMTNTIYAEDNAGNKSVVLSLVLERASIPSIVILSLANGTLTNTNHIEISGIAGADSPYSVVNVQMQINGGTWSNVSGLDTWSIPITLNVGTNQVHVRAITDDGKTNTTSVWNVVFSTYEWTRIIGDNGNSFAYSITIDSRNNILIIGESGYQIIVTEINSIDCTTCWVKSTGYTGYCNHNKGSDIICGNTGKVYLTGELWQSTDFGNDFSEYSTSDFIAVISGVPNAFLSAIGDVGGTFYYRTKQFTGTYYIYGQALAFDNFQNVYLLGAYKSVTVNFRQTFGGADNKTNAGGYDIFLTKISNCFYFSPSTSYCWTKRIGGTGDDIGNSVAVDGSGNIYLTGSFKNSVNFRADWGGSDSKTATGGDIYITKLTNYGSYCWTKKIGGTGDDTGNSITLDNSGNIYLVGVFQNTVNFSSDWSGTDSKTNAGGNDICVTKINAFGTYGWTKRIGGTGDDQGKCIKTDGNGDIYITGNFQNTINFAADWGGTDIKTSMGGYDIFITKIESDGSYGWTKTIGGSGNDYGTSIAIDSNEYIYLCGYFGSSIIDFAKDFYSTDSQIYFGGTDIFLTKFKSW
jgi:hypothetical protein